MSTPPISHPPTPAGATTRELQTITALHRAATIEHEEGAVNPASRVMLEGVALIVALIKQRGDGQAFIRAIEHQNEYAG